MRRSKKAVLLNTAMATVDKTSIREEIDRLKQDFEKLCSEGKASPEIQAVMNSMLLIVELILAVFLEKKTRKGNKNSSLPSSQTPKDETAKSTPKSNGKGKQVSGELGNNPYNRNHHHLQSRNM